MGSCQFTSVAKRIGISNSCCSAVIIEYNNRLQWDDKDSEEDMKRFVRVFSKKIW
jgi:hypothetical protein